MRPSRSDSNPSFHHGSETNRVCSMVLIVCFKVSP